MKPARMVGILYQPKLLQAQGAAREIEAFLKSLGVKVWVASVWDEADTPAHMDGTDFVLTLGGDGSILRAARATAPLGVPLVGVNLGRLGFMTEMAPDEVKERLPDLLEGKGRIEERIMLQADLVSAAEDRELGNLQQTPLFQGFPLHALNDVFVGRGTIARAVQIRTYVNQELIGTFRADGIIVATPTGSTGYALAVGGPILYPTLRDLVIKPVSVHLSTFQGLVVPDSSVIELQVLTDHQAVLSVDGQIDIQLYSGDAVVLRRSPLVARFLRCQPENYFYGTLNRLLK